MPRIICLALGCIWRWDRSKNRDKLISYMRRFDIDGIEITLSCKEEVYDLKLSKRNIEWLKSLKYVSIHAPFALVRRAKDNNEIIKQLDKISSIYKKINAKNVIIHPTDLPDPEILNRYNIKFST
jgi:hypothetical protein